MTTESELIALAERKERKADSLWEAWAVLADPRREKRVHRLWREAKNLRARAAAQVSA